MRSILSASVGLLLLAAPVRAGEPVVDKTLGFEFALPEDFERTREREQGVVAHAFHRFRQRDETLGTFILVQRLGGVIGRDRADTRAAAVRANPALTTSTERWGRIEIDVFRVPEVFEESDVLTFNAQIPLKGMAIQVSVIGDADREELRAILRSILASLKGESSWADEKAEIKETAAYKIGYACGQLGCVGVVVGAVVALVYYSTRKATRDRDRLDRPRRRRPLAELFERGSDAALCDRLFDRIDRAGRGPPDAATLPDEERTVYLVWAAFGELGRGGFRSLFETRIAGDPDYALTRQAFREIGCREAAEAITGALAAFPDGDPPGGRTERMRVYLARSPESPSLADLAFRAVKNDIPRLLAAWVRPRRHAFLRPEPPR